MAEQAFATQAEQGGDIAGQAASNLGLGSYLGTALGAAPSILSIIQALQARRSGGHHQPAGPARLLGASAFDLIPTAASVAGGEAGGAAAGGDRWRPGWARRARRSPSAPG